MLRDIFLVAQPPLLARRGHGRSVNVPFGDGKKISGQS
jgi:hypothetical protein